MFDLLDKKEKAVLVALIAVALVAGLIGGMLAKPTTTVTKTVIATNTTTVTTPRGQVLWADFKYNGTHCVITVHLPYALPLKYEVEGGWYVYFGIWYSNGSFNHPPILGRTNGTEIPFTFRCAREGKYWRLYSIYVYRHFGNRTYYEVGLFDRPLNDVPVEKPLNITVSVIYVITTATGADFRDAMSRLGFSPSQIGGVPILVWPTP